MVKRPQEGAIEAVKQRLSETTQTGVWTVKDTPSKRTPTIPKRHSEQAEQRSEVISHQLRLRHDFVVKLKLPVDLTDEEAERLSMWVQALPIG
jgi:hypothetical protein